METNRMPSAEVLAIYGSASEFVQAKELIRKHDIRNYTLSPMAGDQEQFFKESHWRGKVVVAMFTASVTSMELAVTPYRELKQCCDKVGAAFRVLALGGTDGGIFEGVLSGCNYKENEFNQLLEQRQVTRNSFKLPSSLNPSRFKRWFAPVCFAVVTIAAVIFTAYRLYSRLV